MKKILNFLFVLGCATPLFAAEQVTITLTVTNIPTAASGHQFILNSDTRTWTNAYDTDQILTNLTTTAGAATNLMYGLSAYRHADLTFVSQTATNVVKMWGASGTTMTINSVCSNWCSWVYTTNTVTAAHAIRVPHSVESATNQTNFASQLATYLSKASNEFLMHWDIMGQVAGLTNNNGFSGTNVFVNSHSTNQNIVNAKGISGTLGALTNGVLTNTVLVKPTISNGTAYSGFSSVGSGINSEQYGTSAAATGGRSVALGYYAQAGATNAIAIGSSADASAPNDVVIGRASEGGGGDNIVLGSGSAASKTNGITIGNGSINDFTNSVVIGNSTTAATNDQILLGASTHSVRIPGRLEVTGTMTNCTITGTNSMGVSGGPHSFLAIRRYDLTTLANGNNPSLNIGNASYVKVSGPTAAFYISGITNWTDGRVVILENATSYTMTLANESGGDGSPANRILTFTGYDIVLASQSTASLIYDTGLNRWVVLWTSADSPTSYGELYRADSAVSQTLNADPATYNVLTNLTSSGGSVGTTLDAAGCTITVDAAGIYQAAYSMSVDGDAATTYTFAVFTNGVVAVNTQQRIVLDTATEAESVSSSSLLTLPASAVVDVRAKGSGGGDAIVVTDGNFNIVKFR